MDLRYRTPLHSRLQLLGFSTIVPLDQQADCYLNRRVGYRGTSCGIAGECNTLLPYFYSGPCHRRIERSVEAAFTRNLEAQQLEIRDEVPSV